MFQIYAIRKLTDEEAEKIRALEFETEFREIMDKFDALEFYTVPGQSIDEVSDDDDMMKYTNEISLREEASWKDKKKGILPPYRTLHIFHKRLLEKLDKPWMNGDHIRKTMEQAQNSLLPGEKLFFHNQSY